MHMRTFVSWTLAAALLLPTAALAQSLVRAWQDVESIRAQTKAAQPAGAMAGQFASDDTPLWLAPDGRFAIELPRFGDEASPHVAMLGRWSRDGDWLEIVSETTAVDASHLGVADRLRVEAATLASDLALAAGDPARAERLSRELAEAIEALRAHVDDEEHASLTEALEDLAAQEPPNRDPTTLRMLVVSLDSGVYLLEENDLKSTASRWDGDALELEAAFWRLHQRGTPAGAFDGRLVVERPLSAGLPEAITRLLIPQQLRVRVVEQLLAADALEWSHHRAKARIRLDLGSDAGLFVGQELFGLPPDEAVLADIVEVDAASAVAEVMVERFAPDDRVQLPAPGMAFSNRPQHTMGCGLPQGVAVSAEVLAVDTRPEDLAWDHEGYAWFSASIDRGARDGLAAGDRMSLDSDGEWCSCEGRVEAVDSQRASVRFRAQRYGQDLEDLRLPVVGDSVATPAWLSAKWQAEAMAREAAVSDSTD